MNPELEKYRVQDGEWGTAPGSDHGLFRLPSEDRKTWLLVMCAPMRNDWQHVSVSTKHRTPTWEEMAEIKKLFWGEDVTVVQYHPKKSEYVNNHPYCLHLWRNTKAEHELPPSLLVGIK